MSHTFRVNGAGRFLDSDAVDGAIALTLVTNEAEGHLFGMAYSDVASGSVILTDAHGMTEFVPVNSDTAPSFVSLAA